MNESEVTNKAVVNLLNASPVNLIIIIVGICLVIILASIFIPRLIKKLGVKKFNIGGNSIELKEDVVKHIENKTSNEIHEILRKQLSFVDEYLKYLRNSINNFIERKGYRYSDFPVPLVIELIKDEIISWLIFNSMEDTVEYVALHQEKLWLVYSNAMWSSNRGLNKIKIKYNNDYIDRDECEIDFNDDYFKQLMYKSTSEVVTNLVKIKLMHKSFAKVIK